MSDMDKGLRRAEQSGDSLDLLAQRLRAGELPLERLELAAGRPS